MSRVRLMVALGLVVSIACWLVLRPSPRAAAAQPSQPEITSFGENTEEVAQHRWQSNQARHWRQAVTRR